MNMLDIAVYKINKNILFSRIFPNMLKDLLPDVIAQERFSIFCRPNKM
jgi:hypothetical protein